MTTRVSASLAVAVALWSVSLAACRGGTSKAPAGGNYRKTSLALIPADTPYFVVQLAGPTAQEMEQFDQLLASLPEQLEALASRLDEPPPGEASFGRRAIEAFHRELAGKKTAAAVFADLGLNLHGTNALYGIGMMPVLRLSLTDPEKLRAFIARIEGYTGKKLPTATWKGQTYWRGGDQELAFVAIIAGRDLVITVVPTSMEQEMMPLLTGEERPARSLTDSRLDEMRRRSAAGRYLGVLDFQQFATAALDPTSLSARQLTALVGEPLQVPPGCREVVMAAVAEAPRLWFAGDASAGDETLSRGLLELSPTLAKQMMRLRTQVPGMTSEALGRPPLAFGLAFDGQEVLRAIDLLAGWLGATSCQPAIEVADKLREVAEDMASAPSLGPILSGMRGLLVSLEDFVPGPGSDPQLVGYVILAHRDPQTIVDQVNSMMPILAGMKRGKPHDFTVPFLNLELTALLEKTYLAFWDGPDMEAEVKQRTAAVPAKNPPLAIFSYDEGRLLDFSEKWPQLASSLGQKELAEVEDEAARKIVMELQRAGANRTFMVVEATGDGIAILTTIAPAGR